MLLTLLSLSQLAILCYILVVLRRQSKGSEVSSFASGPEEAVAGTTTQRKPREKRGLIHPEGL